MSLDTAPRPVGALAGQTCGEGCHSQVRNTCRVTLCARPWAGALTPTIVTAGQWHGAFASLHSDMGKLRPRWTWKRGERQVSAPEHPAPDAHLGRCGLKVSLISAPVPRGRPGAGSVRVLGRGPQAAGALGPTGLTGAGRENSSAGRWRCRRAEKAGHGALGASQPRWQQV